MIEICQQRKYSKIRFLNDSGILALLGSGKPGSEVLYELWAKLGIKVKKIEQIL